jgi:hypothetical protein
MHVDEASAPQLILEFSYYLNPIQSELNRTLYTSVETPKTLLHKHLSCTTPNIQHSLTIAAYQLSVQLSQKPPGDLYQLTPEPIATPTNQIKMLCLFFKSLSRVVYTLFLTGMGRPVFTGVVLVGAARTRVS